VAPQVLALDDPRRPCRAARNCAEAAVREVHEETGLDIVLVPREPTHEPLPAGGIVVPWAIVEQRIPERAAEAEHIHVDHLYVAQRTNPDAAPIGAEWVKLRQLPSRAMFQETGSLALQFARTLAAAPRCASQPPGRRAGGL